jgi:hypothetical protein
MELTGQNNNHDALYKGFMEALFCSVLIVLITFVLPQNARFLFVVPIGDYGLLPVVGPLLALGLVLRWRPSRKIAIVLFTLLLPFFAFEARPWQPSFLGHSLLFILDLALLYLLFFRRDLRHYLREPGAA